MVAQAKCCLQRRLKVVACIRVAGWCASCPMYQGGQQVCSTLQGDASAFSGHRGLRFLLCYRLHCGCREGPDPYKPTCGDSRCAGLFDDGCLSCFLCFLLPLGCPAFSSPAGPVTAEAIFHNREEVAVKVSSSSDVKLR